MSIRSCNRCKKSNLHDKVVNVIVQVERLAVVCPDFANEIFGHDSERFFKAR